MQHDRQRNDRLPPERSPQAAAAVLLRLSPLRPTLAFVLGSGFHPLAAKLRTEVRLPYRKVPGFSRVGVEGHGGQVLIGRLAGTPILLLDGRVHFYEGYPMARVTFPVRALAAYGIRDLVLTNAAGGVNAKFRPGDFMALTDHINFMGTNPLLGNARLGPHRFVDLTNMYENTLTVLLRRAARRSGIKLRTGVYLAVSGPSYETPAEIRAYGQLGADAVGMSTVPEAIVARQCGLNVAGLSCITNLAAGRGPGGLSHADVLETAARAQDKAVRLLETLARSYRPPTAHR